MIVIVVVGALGSKRVPIRQQKRKKRAKRKSRNPNKIVLRFYETPAPLKAGRDQMAKGLSSLSG
jgi:hypothetical protein